MCVCFPVFRLYPSSSLVTSVSSRCKKITSYFNLFINQIQTKICGQNQSGQVLISNQNLEEKPNFALPTVNVG